MTYTVEGVAYATHKLAVAAARELHAATGRTIQVHTGDTTQDSASVETIGAHLPVAANEDLEPVDRTLRLAQRAVADPNSDPVPTLEE
jgi:hypothetical protein